MPKYLDFDATKDFRDKMLNRTLDPVYGKSPSPKTFTSKNYTVQTLGDNPNLLLPQVDGNRTNDLLIPQNSNVFKPNEYFVKDTINDLPRRANLNLYPYFVSTDENLISIMTTKSYDTESELFKFAAKNIRTNPQGPVLARINQNLYTATTAKNKIGEALAGNTTTLINIIRGKEPLVEGNNKITASKSLIGKGIDFLQTVAGTQLPFSTIPGDYLSNPRAPINVRPTDVSTTIKVWQDLTGVLGSIVGIQRRPLPSRKPSDILIENMGDSSKYRLFDLLSFNGYAPNYTTSARSQMSTGLGKIPGLVAQGVKTLLGVEAPSGIAYIGDDRANDVKNATTDLFSGRPVRSSYYLSFMFDPIATELFHNTKSVIENGPIGGNLTWLSKNKTSKNVKTDLIDNSLSTKYSFRKSSILNTTQEILDSKPQNGGDALSHIGHILDQTSKYFKDGGTIVSRGSGVRYLDNSGKDIGIEYARVWTKDRPYLKYGDTMPLYKETTKKPYYSGGTTSYRRTGIRKFDSSVMTNTWNLNMAPMSDGTVNEKFPGSSNILPNPKGNGFYAKKYMLSIENLAWAASTLPGYTVNDLPFCERGPNGGRVMWFPPYDLKVSEQNSAKWEPNIFLGRPEPIYTYQNSERNGTLSFKVIVDHPSVLNLLVREHFKSVKDEDADAYINAFFAGAKDIDFYSLIRQYANLNSDDISMIKNYLNEGGDPSDIKRRKTAVPTPVENNPEGTSTLDANKETIDIKLNFYFPNNVPEAGTEKYQSNQSINYAIGALINNNINVIQTIKNDYRTGLTEILTTDNDKNNADRQVIFNTKTLDSNQTGTTINNKITDLETLLSDLKISYDTLESTITTLKKDLEDKNVGSDVVVVIQSYTSKLGDTNENFLLSMRRSHSLFSYIIKNLDKNGSDPNSKWKFNSAKSIVTSAGSESFSIPVNYNISDLGFESNKQIIFSTTNNGTNYNLNNSNCNNSDLKNENLYKFSTLSYGCRSSEFRIQYDKIKKVDKSSNVSTLPIGPTGNVPTSNTKPPVDLMKRIIMKTLSEDYYFKKLEEDSPMIYSSIKQKLKYFHPGFHSMTPEGLNSRLTFLQQCLRPGNTIPVKGLSDDSDINARNTTFGPPPICILRVGDFYNSKVLIKDLNIQFEQNVWDMNPEGIGIQPMIADVTMQISFLGGHGLEKPIERLQNALSSNFFANTEMYDERSESTNTTIGGKDAKQFTREFIQSLNDTLVPVTTLKDSTNNGSSQGVYIGTLIDGKALDYTTVVNNLYKNTNQYFNSYQKLFNSILTKYGKYLTNLVCNKDYRTINEYDVYTGGTETDTINLFGLYPNDKSLPSLCIYTSDSLSDYLITVLNKNDKYYILKMLNLYDLIPDGFKDDVALNLHTYIVQNLSNKFNELSTFKNITDFETNRDELIKSIDQVNFITKYGFDVKLEKELVTQNSYVYDANLKSKFYSNYSNCIDHIKKNTNKMYSKLDTSINFKQIEFTYELAQDLIQVLFYDEKTNIVNSVAAFLPNEYIDKITQKLTNVLYIPKEININFTKDVVRKNNNQIKIDLIPNLEIPNNSIDKNEVKKLLGLPNNVTEKLNYYRK
jgi:hypothetical protein